MTVFKFFHSLFKTLKKKSKGSSKRSSPDVECPSTTFTKPFSASAGSQTCIIRTFEQPRRLTSQHFHFPAAPEVDANTTAHAYPFIQSRMIAVQNGLHIAPAILPTQDFVRHVQESLQAKRTYFHLLEEHECVDRKECRLLWQTWERYCRLRDGVDIRLEEVWIGCGLLDREHKPEPYIFEEDLWEEDEESIKESEGQNEKGCGYGKNMTSGAPVLPELSFLKDNVRGEERTSRLPVNNIFPESGGVFDGPTNGRNAPRLIVRRVEGLETIIRGSTRHGDKQGRRPPKPSRHKRRVHWDEQNLGERSTELWFRHN